MIMPLSIVQGNMASSIISKAVVLGCLYKCGTDMFRMSRLVNFELVQHFLFGIMR